MILITLDIDWASDFTIKKVDEILKEKNIKATWFVTHKSAYLKNLSKNRNYELGIHPNFLSNTTQGKTPKEILKKRTLKPRESPPLSRQIKTKL